MPYLKHARCLSLKFLLKGMKNTEQLILHHNLPPDYMNMRSFMFHLTRFCKILPLLWNYLFHLFPQVSFVINGSST